MELNHVFIILSVDLFYMMLATGQPPDPPTDVRIDIINDTAIVSWIIPSNQGINWSVIQLYNSKEGDVYLDQGRKHKYLRFPRSSFEIAKLKMCSEYYVRIRCKRRSAYSEFTTQKFWMTNKTFTAEIYENVAITWRTFSDIYAVTTPTKSVIYAVQLGSLISNSKEMSKYKFDQSTTDVSSINITVISVKQIDAGLYGSVDAGSVDVKGCCVLVVTTRPMNPILTIKAERPFANNSITFTCNSTVQRWPEYVPSKLSYQYFGNPRGYTNGNKLILKSLTKSDTGIDVSCQATDDRGKASNMSNTVTLGQYYGPDIVLVKPEYTVINVTEGSKLGPIHCTADCYPKCIFNWKYKKSEHFELVHLNPILTVTDIKRNKAGIYRCSVVHPYDITFMRKVDIEVNVQYSSKIRELLLSDKIETNEWSNATVYSFSEDVNLKMKLSIESNPDPQLVLRTSLITFPPLRYKKRGIAFLSELPSLTCIDSGNYTIQAFNGIKYGDARTVNLMIYCKPRNVISNFKNIETKVNGTEDIVMQIVAFPKPSVAWIRSTGFIWMVQKDRYDYRYRIYSSIHINSKNDFGEYGIHVCNRFGCIVENITITFEDEVGAVTNEYPRIFAAGITTLVIGLIVLIPGTIFVICKCLRTIQKLSAASDEYIEVHRSNPAVAEPYSTLQSQSESRHLQEPESRSLQEPESRSLQEPSNDTYEECGMTTAVDIYQNVKEESSFRMEHECTVN
ncbi:cell adhesion molecule CEACAM1-like isoform X2 [Mytilus edulis]|uniref:cell adhesion molecule CEACAM1-like isoform X2 n=1 Tax=Mytilus edulis TaxID=6550 RepID=UPI0039EE7D4C